MIADWQYNLISIKFGFNYLGRHTLADVRCLCLSDFQGLLCYLAASRIHQKNLSYPVVIITITIRWNNWSETGNYGNSHVRWTQHYPVYGGHFRTSQTFSLSSSVTSVYQHEHSEHADGNHSFWSWWNEVLLGDQTKQRYNNTKLVWLCCF